MLARLGIGKLPVGLPVRALDGGASGVNGRPISNTDRCCALVGLSFGSDNLRAVGSGFTGDAVESLCLLADGAVDIADVGVGDDAADNDDDTDEDDGLETGRVCGFFISAWVTICLNFSCFRFSSHFRVTARPWVRRTTAVHSAYLHRALVAFELARPPRA